MASIKQLKKDLNYVLGDIIDEVYAWELLNPTAETVKSEAIIDEAIATFDELIEKINTRKDIENQKAYFKAINQELEEKANALLDKVNNL
ncbi:hypothetical protein [Aureivirga sp. CE67]|uniref:hypothetical protein n=1 Tax=Aureivirga sp. CE67 TaxID=1788983 RepID=UPI0018C930AE|nr:hypothetical protein [Aureivirga sp. CE67]